MFFHFICLSARSARSFHFMALWFACRGNKPLIGTEPSSISCRFLDVHAARFIKCPHCAPFRSASISQQMCYLCAHGTMPPSRWSLHTLNSLPKTHKDGFSEKHSKRRSLDAHTASHADSWTFMFSSASHV